METKECHEGQKSQFLTTLAKAIGAAALGVILSGCQESPNERIIRAVESIRTGSADRAISCVDTCEEIAPKEFCDELCEVKNKTEEPNLRRKMEDEKMLS